MSCADRPRGNVYISVMLLAEAGLSECARDAACSAEFNRPFYILIALLVLISVSITASLFASVDIGSRRLGLQRSAMWLAVVWLLPIVGAVAWGVRRWGLRESRPVAGGG